MYRVLTIMVLVVLLLAGGLLAQSRAEKPNDVTIELGGRSFIYSLTYQRLLAEQFGLEFSISGLGAGGGNGGGAVFFLGGGARAYLTKKAASPYIAGGIVYVTSATTVGPRDELSDVYFYATPGFELRAPGGFLFRGGVNLVLLKGGYFFVWPGINLGITF